MARNTSRTATAKNATKSGSTKKSETTKVAAQAAEETSKAAAEATAKAAEKGKEKPVPSYDATNPHEELSVKRNKTTVTWRRPLMEKNDEMVPASRKSSFITIEQDGKDAPILENEPIGAGREQYMANAMFFLVTGDKQFLTASGEAASHLSRTMEGDLEWLTKKGLEPAEIKDHEFVDCKGKKKSWEKYFKELGDIEIINDTRYRKPKKERVSKKDEASSARMDAAIGDNFIV